MRSPRAWLAHIHQFRDPLCSACFMIFTQASPGILSHNELQSDASAPAGLRERRARRRPCTTLPFWCYLQTPVRVRTGFPLCTFLCCVPSHQIAHFSIWKMLISSQYFLFMCSTRSFLCETLLSFSWVRSMYSAFTVGNFSDFYHWL